MCHKLLSKCSQLHSLTACLCFLLSCRYSHVSPLELDKFLEDVKWVQANYCSFCKRFWDKSTVSFLQEWDLSPDELCLVLASPCPPSSVFVPGAGWDGEDADSWAPGDRNQEGSTQDNSKDWRHFELFDWIKHVLRHTNAHTRTFLGCRLFRCIVIWSQMKKGPKLMWVT